MFFSASPSCQIKETVEAHHHIKIKTASYDKYELRRFIITNMKAIQLEILSSPRNCIFAPMKTGNSPWFLSRTTQTDVPLPETAVHFKTFALLAFIFFLFFLNEVKAWWDYPCDTHCDLYHDINKDLELNSRSSIPCTSRIAGTIANGIINLLSRPSAD